MTAEFTQIFWLIFMPPLLVLCTVYSEERSPACIILKLIFLGYILVLFWSEEIILFLFLNLFPLAFNSNAVCC